MKNFCIVLIVLAIGVAGLTGCGKKDDTTVTKEVTKETAEASGEIKLAKEEYLPGEDVSFTFSTEGEFGRNAWIGVIPSEIEHGDETKNDQHDISYVYFKGTSGSSKLKAPDKPGKYDLRMHTSDANGKEVTYVSFTVKEATEEPGTETKSEGKYTLSSNKTSYKPGEAITVKFTASSDWGNNAWIGIIPSDIKHGDESENDKHDVAYQYLRGKSSGTITLNAPSKPGKYDLRMHDTDSNGKEITYISFTVK